MMTWGVGCDMGYGWGRGVLAVIWGMGGDVGCWGVGCDMGHGW